MTNGWATSAPPPPPPPPARGLDPGRLTGIDHVALAAPFDRFDDSVLFLRAVLGLEPGDDLELADPQGLVRSRVLSSADGAAGGVRIALNMPPLGSRAGPGAQHVAFSCDDVFAVSAALAAAGAPLLAIPENCSRICRPAWTWTRAPSPGCSTRAFSTTGTPGASSSHFYTAQLGLRLFIEVIQRRGDYAGYGAVNAPTRMAAQRAPDGHRPRMVAVRRSCGPRVRAPG